MHRCQISFKKFLQIYELLGWETSVSKKFLMLASPRLYLRIFFQIYDSHQGAEFQVNDGPDKKLQTR
jgi:hypothetical protein